MKMGVAMQMTMTVLITEKKVTRNTLRGGREGDEKGERLPSIIHFECTISCKIIIRRARFHSKIYALFFDTNISKLVI